ncbi:MSCRAMM family adhesin SdrC [Pseudoalteromonas maricaloris]|uniref:MSCRAMM family adhesin SdrC n=1 Tax=Pseudoalteromonas maricaloris TaxID=184924 RepID=UPI0002F4F76C|nr:MSCRAMM family adhesin SdrC [Pseudoalteromonas flavipulchra]
MSVIDDFSGGAPDYSYEIYVFKDKDTDGIDDHAEYAIGVEPTRIDTDRDSIHDFYEYYVKQGATLDEDNNGVINLLDLDSDGDGISDEREGSGNADQDDKLNFLDLDSDNDGIADADEKLNAKGWPEDSDKDGVEDFIDLDNDGDKVLDIYDAEPYERVRGFRLSDSPSVQISSQAGYYNGYSLPRIYRIGDSVVFSGDDFAGLENPKVVIYNGDDIYNIAPTSHTNSELIFELNLPFRQYKAFIYTRNKRSNEVRLSPYKAGSPLIFGYASIKVQEGEQYELKGVGFDDKTRIIMGNKTLVPSTHTPSSLTFTIPTGITKGILQLTNNVGTSNKVRYRLQAR